MPTSMSTGALSPAVAGYHVDGEGARRSLLATLQNNRHLSIFSVMLGIAAVDATLIFLAFKGVSVAYRMVASPPKVALLSWWMILGYLVSASVLKAYTVKVLEQRQSALELTARAMARALVFTAIAIFLLSVSEAVSRVVFLAGSATATVLLLLHRAAATRFYLRLVQAFGPSTLIVAPGARSANPADGPADFYRDACPDPTRPETLDAFGERTRRYDRVIVACAPHERAQWAFALRCCHVRGEIVTEELEALAPLGVAHDAGAPRLIVSAPGLTTHERVIKRALDLGIACFALIAMVPVFAVVAFLIKLEDGGPILFRQQRVGRANRFFDVLKFRTMRVDRCDPAAATLTVRGDARVTTVGRWLRATSIDELPQLVNVLRGEMSIVGPRPHALGAKAGSELYWEVAPNYWHRHIVKPGLTGLAQVRGFRGPTDESSDLSRRLSADLEYTRCWTVWRDLIIIARTVSVLRHGNAF